MAFSSTPAAVPLPPLPSGTAAAMATDIEPICSPPDLMCETESVVNSYHEKTIGFPEIQPQNSAEILTSPKFKNGAVGKNSLHSRACALTSVHQGGDALHGSAVQQNGGALFLSSMQQDSGPQCCTCTLPQTPSCDQRDRWPPAAAPPLAIPIIARRGEEATILQFFKETQTKESDLQNIAQLSLKKRTKFTFFRYEGLLEF